MDFGKIITISDVHIGAVPAKQLEMELELFMGTVDELRNKGLKMVVIVGDYFDRKINMNSDHAKLAISLVDRLVKMAQESKFHIRMLRGTLSHDLSQLEVFRHYHDDFENTYFRIINKVETEHLSVGDNWYSFLYIPEEYMDNPEEYYADFFPKSKKSEIEFQDSRNREFMYDMIFGHGMFNHNSYQENSESERHIKAAPHFDFDRLKDYAQAINFGHIHTGGVYEKKLIYNGSFSRWIFGEEEPKGFYVYDLKSNGLSHRFIENKQARKFITIDVDTIVASDLSIEDKIVQIEALVNDENIHKTRIIYGNLEGHEELQTKMIRDYFAKNNPDNVSVKITNLKLEKSDSEEVETVNEFEFIFDKTLPIYDKIQLYIDKKVGRKIEISDIKELLKSI